MGGAILSDSFDFYLSDESELIRAYMSRRHATSDANSSRASAANQAGFFHA